MKQLKALTALLLPLALCLSLLTACGSGNKYSAGAEAGAPSLSPSEDAYTEEPSFEMGYDDADSEMESAEDADGSSVYQRSDVKLIRRASLSVETTDFDAACAALEALTSKMGGYLENTEVYQGSYNTSYRSADYTVRVPADQYNTFLSGMDNGETFHVTHKNESTEDVGNDYADIEARVKALKTKRDRLNKLLEQADNMEDIITIESALTDTEAHIERLTANLTRYDRLISYATINVSIEQVRVITETIEDPFLQRIVTSFNEGANDFVVFLQDVAIWLAGSIFQLLLWVLVLTGLFQLLRRILSRPEKKLKTVRKKSALPAKKEEKAVEAPKKEE